MFSGEDFRDLAEIEDLKVRGHECDPENASYLVHLYEEKGIKFIETLNGRFSGLLADLRERKIVLFNDRYGLGRIYYHENARGFYFASEAKALLRVLPELRQIDMVSLGELFSCGCPLQNRTIFSGISQVPGGSAWVFSNMREMKRENYFRPEVWENQLPLNEDEYYDKLRETFKRVLPRYYRGERGVAVSLTGGIDSRMIMAWTRHPPGALPCYTFGGMFRDCNDVKIARQVAEICSQPHEVISVGREFLSQFPDLAEKTVYLTDGAMDVSGSPDLFVNKIARQVATVRLTGNYGGEILRNIVAFKPTQLFEGIFDSQFREFVRTASLTYHSELAQPRLSFIAFKQVPWHHYSRLSLESSQVTMRTPYLDNDLVSLAYQAPTDLSMGNEPFMRLIAEGNASLGSIRTDRSALYHSGRIRNRIQSLYQTITFKAEYAFDYGMPHWLAKLDSTLTQLHLEKLFIGRHKFYHFRLWYRTELAEYLKDILLDPRTRSRPYFSGQNLEKIVLGHTRGEQNYTLELHRALTVELIQRQLIETP
jgi:asparagine synthase (glutamine-hydrolysing)